MASGFSVKVMGERLSDLRRADQQVHQAGTAAPGGTLRAPATQPCHATPKPTMAVAISRNGRFAADPCANGGAQAGQRPTVRYRTAWAEMIKPDLARDGRTSLLR